MAKDVLPPMTEAERVEFDRLRVINEWRLFEPAEILAAIRAKNAAAASVESAPVPSAADKRIVEDLNKNPPTHDPEILFKEVLAVIAPSTKYGTLELAHKSWRWAASKDDKTIRMEWPASVNPVFLQYLDQAVIDTLWPEAEFKVEETGIATLLKKLSGKRVVSFCCQDEWLLRVVDAPNAAATKDYVDFQNSSQRIRIYDFEPRAVFFGCRGTAKPRTLRVGMRLVVAQGVRDIIHQRILGAQAITIVGFKESLVVCHLTETSTYNSYPNSPSLVFLIPESNLHNIFEEPNVAP